MPVAQSLPTHAGQFEEHLANLRCELVQYIYRVHGEFDTLGTELRLRLELLESRDHASQERIEALSLAVEAQAEGSDKQSRKLEEVEGVCAAFDKFQREEVNAGILTGVADAAARLEGELRSLDAARRNDLKVLNGRLSSRLDDVERDLAKHQGLSSDATARLASLESACRTDLVNMSDRLLSMQTEMEAERTRLMGLGSACRSDLENTTDKLLTRLDNMDASISQCRKDLVGVFSRIDLLDTSCRADLEVVRCAMAAQKLDTLEAGTGYNLEVSGRRDHVRSADSSHPGLERQQVSKPRLAEDFERLRKVFADLAQVRDKEDGLDLCSRNSESTLTKSSAGGRAF
mmetsp:Transcript_52204/g.139058  ORF Transcript_52204/g.139058 Transcript_52204/m.139058 type:complete len:346 (-) Transcript_52204:523-1560(-)